MDARYVVAYASDAAFAVDENLKIVAWNYAARALLGYTRHEVIGKHCSEILQLVLPNGEPLCVPGCEGVRCFEHFRPFTTANCLARHKESHWIALEVASVVTPKRARARDRRSAVATILLRRHNEIEASQSNQAVLQIFTFGRFGLAFGGRGLVVEKWERQHAVTLLKVLVAHAGRAIPREVLIDYLWPDADERNGWERLKVTVYFLRRRLRVAGVAEDVVETVNRAYRLRPEAVWIDAEVYECCIAAGSTYQTRQRWYDALDQYRKAHRLYRGPYLSGDMYADWCAEERERLREIHLEMLTDLAKCHSALDGYVDAARVCREILADDPCRESAHRALMENLVRLGRNDSALAQYRQCRQILADELGVEPMLETQALHRQIVARGRAAAAASTEAVRGAE